LLSGILLNPYYYKVCAKIRKFNSLSCRLQKISILLQSLKKGGVLPMIIVPVKEGENIERALKKFKRKFEKTGAIRELRSRKTFVKKSVKKRDELKKAIYVQALRLKEE